MNFSSIFIQKRFEKSVFWYGFEIFWFSLSLEMDLLHYHKISLNRPYVTKKKRIEGGKNGYAAETPTTLHPAPPLPTTTSRAGVMRFCGY